MSLQLQTDKADQDGENEGSSSNKPTLKEFLSLELGQIADEIHTKLASEVGITEIDSLIFIDQNDLNEVCQALELKLKEKIKFKTAIRKLQHSHKPKQPQSIVTISPTEQSQIDKIDLAIKQSSDIQHIFEQHFTEIDDHVITTKSELNTQIDDVIKSLQNRKKLIHQKLEEWKLGKLEAINKEIANIVEYHNELKASKVEINDLLRKSGVSKREKKITKIVDALFKLNEKYKVYQEIKLLEQHMMNNTKMIGVVFQEEIRVNRLELYGEFNEEVKSDTFNLPSIMLGDVIKMQQDDNGYKVQLKWEVVCHDEHKSTDFAVKYSVDSDNNDDEQKDVKEEASINWMMLDDPKIKREEKNKYSVHIADYFMFDKKYYFVIENVFDKPLSMVIQSNITNIRIQSALDMSKEEQISLKVHSHKGHCGSHVPENILESNNNEYWSQENEITNDWIILESNNDNMHYPTKLQVRTRGSGGIYCLKRFCLKIGSTESNEWIQLIYIYNQQLFTASSDDNKMQTFVLDIVHNKEKWKSLKSKRFKQFKLEILDNYGGPFIIFKELKIFGVKM